MINEYRYDLGCFSQYFYTLSLSGRDLFSFLQKQSTFAIDQIPDSGLQLISFLDPVGKIEFYGWLLKEKGAGILLVPRLLHQKAINRLNRYLVSEDVEIQDHGLKKWSFIMGPSSVNVEKSHIYSGIMFDELARCGQGDILKEIPEIPSPDVEKWRVLNGYPSFDAYDFKSEIINNTRLFDLSVSLNKGCYPGQETVSKIATRRGAGFAPVLIETETQLHAGEILNHGKKIGDCIDSIPWDGKFYAPASLLRDFRVQELTIEFTNNSTSYSGKVVYYPLLPGDKTLKAQELFYAASEAFKSDKLDEAERLFRKSILVDENFADAFESLGVLLGRQERFQEAIEVMNQLVSVDPDSVLAHSNLSLYLMRLGKIQEAEEEKSKATLKSFKKFGEEAKQKKLKEEQRSRQEAEWVQRESMFKQVLEIDPEDTLANYGLGSISVERGEWEKGIDYLTKVLDADSSYSVAYLALGKAYKGHGKIELAKETFEKGIFVAAKKGDLMPANQMKNELNQL